MSRAFFASLCTVVVLCLAAVLPPGARAQQSTVSTAARPIGVNVNLKDGKQILGTAFRMEGSTLLVTQPIGTGTGEIGYPLAEIDRVDFPEPAQLTGALAQLAQDKDGESLAQIDPIITYYAPLHAVPGNWWLPAALVKLDALAGLRREHDVDVLLAEVAALPASPTTTEAVRLRTAETLLRRDKPELAEKIFDEIIKTHFDDEAVSRAWIGKGYILLKRKEFEPALLAYLHVPVFYPDNRRHLSDALLGSGRAFESLDNHDKARETFLQIINDDPSSASAREAKVELERIPSADKPVSSS